MENTTNNLVLTGKVEAFKLIARDALRMNLINPRLSRITSIEANIKLIQSDIKKVEHEINVVNYDIAKLDVSHPNFAATKERKEDTLKNLGSAIEPNTKEIAKMEKEIADQKAAILKIETGETKVSLEDLNDLTDRLIKQDALNQVK